MIPYSHQSVDDDDVAAVVKVLKGDWLTQGPHLDDFEDALASYVGSRYAVGFSSGTAALHAAASVAELGAGDTVATSALSFVASANCARYVGAEPLLVDIDPATLNMNPAQMPPDASALIAVHYAGLPFDLSSLRVRPRIIIEDAAHALGAATEHGRIGNCALSDMCIFSFHAVKTITTGEGGAVTTNSGSLREALRRFRHHGISPKPEKGGWYYEIEHLGFNYRLTDVQAALGTSQLRKIERFLDRRRELAEKYRSGLGDLPVELPPRAPASWIHAHHLFPVRVQDRHRVYDGMRASGIGVQVHYLPIYAHPVYQPVWAPSQFPETERAYASLLSLPLYPGLTDAEQDTVIHSLKAVIA